MTNFWEKLPKPFFALAPMEDVTDAAFRRLIAHYGKPDVFYTEFTSADGMVLAPKEGQVFIRQRLIFSKREHPIVAQLFSATPERIEKAAAIAHKLGFDGIDINMGCPDKAIEKGMCGAAMIKNPELAKEIIRAAKRGAKNIPVSIKTRIGYSKNELDTWLPILLHEDIAEITIHARTREELSDTLADWSTIKQAVEIRDKLGYKTLIVGNGDARDLNDARGKIKETGCDGVMFGRAIYGNPWLFTGRSTPPQPKEKIEALIEHIKLFKKLLAKTNNYDAMKKHFKAYISGWDNAKDLRNKLMGTKTPKETIKLLNEYKSKQTYL